MKKKLKSCIALVLMLCCFLGMVGCDEQTETMSGETEDGVELSFSAEFYDNSGNKWFEAQGNNFDLKPNKEKCYGYNTDGNWTYWYETSSIVTCYIDGHQIDSCGSTIIFKDKRIEPCDIKFDEINMSDEYWDYESSIDVENKLSAEDYIKIRFWWDTQKANGKTPKSRLVVVQSQKGNPITMFAGDDVTWSFSSLPKTTHIVIDGMDLYLHRSNYAIIDTELLSSN